MITNGGLLGFMGLLGHANFFPNNGRVQPGCESDLTGNCSHQRTIAFYVESINAIFTAHACPFDIINAEQCTQTGTTARMGGPHPANINLRGSFFLPTREEAPFSLG